MTLKTYRVRNDDSGFKELFDEFQTDLLYEAPVEVGEWQSQKIDAPMRELRNVSFSWRFPDSAQELAIETGAHLPWAEDHFLERVGGKPLNPAPSEAWWPFAQRKSGDTNAAHKSEGEAFSHTYPERMWPKYGNQEVPQIGKIIRTYPHKGIRFEYGDLMDVVHQLERSPNTRQAFLPIWFPEDTGAVHGKRVPCTLGYHFAIRDSVLDITYYMRSTDLLRHFQDDIYLGCRLAQWMVGKLQDRHSEFLRLQTGEIIFHTANLHIFDADVEPIKYRRSQGLVW